MEIIFCKNQNKYIGGVPFDVTVTYKENSNNKIFVLNYDKDGKNGKFYFNEKDLYKPFSHQTENFAIGYLKRRVELNFLDSVYGN